MKNVISFLIDNYKIVIAVILALYEFIVRVIPTAKNWSILSGIINAIKWLSDKLNNQVAK